MRVGFHFVPQYSDLMKGVVKEIITAVSAVLTIVLAFAVVFLGGFVLLVFFFGGGGH